ncbi:MAG: SHD1 domain-containing protein [Thermoguttaceae bacterium]
MIARFSRSRPVISALAVVLLAALCGRASAADAPTRRWVDGSGRFTIDARLLQRNATHVQLGTADGRTLAVPIAQLSHSDQDYLKGLEPAPAATPGQAAAPASPPTAAAPPAAPELLKADAGAPTAPETATLPGSEETLSLPTEDPPRGLLVDPAGPVKPLSSANLEVAPCDAYDKVSPPVLVDDDAGLVALSINRNKADEPNSRRGRVFLARLQDRKVDVVCDVPGGFQLLDFEPASGRTLAVSGLDNLSRGGELVLFEGLAEGKMNPVLRRRLPGIDKPGFKPQVRWARLLSDEHAVCLVDNDLFFWNLRTAALQGRVDKVDSAHLPALSPGRRYLAIPRDGGAALVDVVDRSCRGFVRIETSLTPAVAFDREGRRLGLTADNQFLVWDCADGRSECAATLPAHLGGPLLGWVGPNWILTASGRLIRSDLGMTVWTYSIAGGAEATGLVGGILLAKKSNACEISFMPIPHAASEKAAQQLAHGGQSLMLLQPGSKVALDAEVSAGMDRATVIAALREAVSKTGWEIADRADTTIVATIGTGKKADLSYQMREMGRSQAAPRTETASITPFTAELQVRRGGKVLWTRKTENRVPGFLILRNGQTLQDAVKQFERPDTSFFARLNIPPRIPAPEIADGLGMSVQEAGQWRDTSAEELARIRQRFGR